MNDAIQDAINGRAGDVQLLDDIMKLAAKDLIFLAVPLILLLWFLPGARAGRAFRQRIAFVAAVAAVLALAAGMLAGQLYSESRPFVSEPGVTHLLISHSADNGFPSDHALVTFAVAGALFAWRWTAGLAVSIAATLIGIARIFVGVHWPLDIVGGAAMGILAGELMARTLPLLEIVQCRLATILPAWLLESP